MNPFEDSENIMNRLSGVIPTLKKEGTSDNFFNPDKNIVNKSITSEELNFGLTEEQKASASNTDIAQMLLSQGEKVTLKGNEYVWVVGNFFGQRTNCFG